MSRQARLEVLPPFFAAALLLSVALWPSSSSAQAPDPGAAQPQAEVGNCLKCHQEQEKIGGEKHANIGCTNCHPNVKAMPHQGAIDEFGPEKMCVQSGCHQSIGEKRPGSPHEGQSCDQCHGYVHDEFLKGTRDDCKGCHGDVARAFAASIHGTKGVGCNGCHDVHAPRRKTDALSPVSKVMQPETCGECHDKKIINNYRQSVHGQGVLRSGLAVAPACASCHGSHDIKAKGDPESRVSVNHVAETCGGCHSFILEKWKTSIHGQVFLKSGAWKGGARNGEQKEGAHASLPQKPPVCTSCHSAHQSFDPLIPANHLKMAEVCNQCHETETESYRDSFHGKATRLGLAVAATCADCHSPHEMLPERDPRSKVNPAALQKTCGDCHAGASASFVRFSPHLDPTTPQDNPTVHWIWLFMTLLLVGVFGFFAVHTALWLQRSIVAYALPATQVALRRVNGHGEAAAVAEGAPAGEETAHKALSGKWVRRFVPIHMWIHVTIILTFLLLATTGLPLKFNYVGPAQGIATVFGGLQATRWLHRAAGILTFGYALTFLVYLVREVAIRKRRSILWGWQSMVPNKKDLLDLWANLKWFLYLGERPKLDRWAYWEKFDFFAVFWGIPMIGLSGLMLWFPQQVTSLIPGWWLNIAYVIHSDEALLATGFIFFFHFFHTHLRPEAFPLDPVMFTGKMTLERFQEERPEEYEHLVKEGTLEKYLVPPPSERREFTAHVFGFIALGVGTLLGIFLIIAGIHGITS